jgi:outer membrane PBP1 activator LpoA protein
LEEWSWLNPGPPVDQGTTDQTLTHVRNQEERKGIKNLLETHKQEIQEIKDATRDLGPTFDKLIKVMNELITNYKQTKQTVKGWVERTAK